MPLSQCFGGQFCQQLIIFERKRQEREAKMLRIVTCTWYGTLPLPYMRACTFSNVDSAPIIHRRKSQHLGQSAAKTRRLGRTPHRMTMIERTTAKKCIYAISTPEAHPSRGRPAKSSTHKASNANICRPINARGHGPRNNPSNVLAPYGHRQRQR